MTDEVLDLDAARAAEADASRRPLIVKVGGKQFTISRPLPLSVPFALVESDWRGVVDGLFGDQAKDALAAGLTQDDVSRIFERLMGGPGKSKASAGSSATAGKRSRSTSKRTTGSTRPKSPRAGS